MGSKLKCLLLDDEIPGLTYLKMLCEQLPNVEVVRAYNDPITLLKELPMLDFDLMVLDIEMPGLNGLELAKLLRGKQVIFTTAYKDYAVQAFELDAVDYILKPVNIQRLHKALEKAMQLKFPGSGKPFFQCNSDQGKAMVYWDTIAFITVAEREKRDKQVHFMDGTVMTLKNISLAKLLHLLPPDLFCRVNKSDIIALKVVKYYTTDYIITNLLDKYGQAFKLTIGEHYRHAFLATFSR